MVLQDVKIWRSRNDVYVEITFPHVKGNHLQSTLEQRTLTRTFRSLTLTQEEAEDNDLLDVTIFVVALIFIRKLSPLNDLHQWEFSNSLFILIKKECMNLPVFPNRNEHVNSSANIYKILCLRNSVIISYPGKRQALARCLRNSSKKSGLIGKGNWKCIVPCGKRKFTKKCRGQYILLI